MTDRGPTPLAAKSLTLARPPWTQPPTTIQFRRANQWKRGGPHLPAYPTTHAEIETEKKKREEKQQPENSHGIYKRSYSEALDSVGGSTGSSLTAIGLDGDLALATGCGCSLDDEHSDGWLVHASTRCHMRL